MVIEKQLYKNKIQDFKKRKTNDKLKAFFGFFLMISVLSYAQDSIPTSLGAEEQNNIDFQEHFFKAVTNKSINNFQKAIENLEECNKMIPNNKAVLFELSKNYYSLGRYTEAIEYANNALALDPKNLWIASHLVKLYKSINSLDEAIVTQKNIIKNYPRKKQDLVFLYLRKNDIVSAKSLLVELEKAKLLSPRLRRIKKKLFVVNPLLQEPKKEVVSNQNVELQFKKNKSFTSLKELLVKLDIENNPKLLPYSEEGMSLFPAQPIVYLMHARANNRTKNFQKAIRSLKNGIDFVIDNPNMQADFYNEIIKSYEGLGDTKNVKTYKKKLKK